MFSTQVMGLRSLYWTGQSTPRLIFIDLPVPSEKARELVNRTAPPERNRMKTL
jgi:hypothetical protein